MDDGHERRPERPRAHASADSGGPETRAHLARGSRRAGRRPSRLLPILASLVALAAAAAALVVLYPRLHEDSPGARSAADGPPSVPAMLLVYQVPGGGQPRQAPDTLGADDALAFAYENRDGKQRLLVFGVDDQGEIYWYHPTRRDPAVDPGAVAIDAGPERRDLPGAVAHHLAGHRLELYGIFTDQPLTVSEVERMVRARERAADPLPLDDAIQHSRQFRIAR